MARWGLLVDKPPAGEPAHVPLELLGTYVGTREDAMRHLGALVRQYRPRHPMNPKRIRRYRTPDGWVLIGDGALGQSYPYRFVLYELEWDSGPL